MSMRIRLGRFLLNFGTFIQSLPVVVMKPDDLIEFSRQGYSRPDNVNGWTEDSLVDNGLSADELDLLADIPIKTGNLLLLGVGGGREAIPLTRMGFRVTGVDYIPAMVERARQNAAKRGITMDGLVQEISQLDVPAGTYDLVWLSRAMYSCIPTRTRRVKTVQRINHALKPGGYFLCQFHWDPRVKLSPQGRLVRWLVALCTLGNFRFVEGDILWLNMEYLHAFASEQDVRSELEEGGLSVLRTQVGQQRYRGSAVCRKNLDLSQNS